MTVTFDDLKKALGQGSSSGLQQTEGDVLNLMLALLASGQFGNFPVTAWADGSVPKALLQSDASEWADCAKTLYSAMIGGVLPLAVSTDGTNNPWVDLWAQSQYNETRNPSTQEVWTVWATNTSGSDIHLGAGELVLGASAGQYYSPVVASTVGGATTYAPVSVTIPNGATNQVVLVQATAATPGSQGITGAGSIVTVISPNVPGLSVTNMNPDTTGSGELVRGADEESDPSLFQRLQGKWPALSLLRGNTRDAWYFWIGESGVNVPRKLVIGADDPGGQGGHVTVYADVGSSDLATLTEYLVAHKPLNMPVTNLHVLATADQTVNVTGQVYVPTAYLSVAQSALTVAVTEYESRVVIGGTVRYWDIGSMIRDISGVDHIESIQLNGSNVDVTLPIGSTPVLNMAGLVWLTP
jgi:hypothetical protein